MRRCIPFKGLREGLYGSKGGVSYIPFKEVRQNLERLFDEDPKMV